MSVELSCAERRLQASRQTYSSAGTFLLEPPPERNTSLSIEMRVIANALYFRRRRVDKKKRSGDALLIPHVSGTHEILGHRRGNGVPMTTDWKNHGLRIVRAGQLDTNRPQTPGM